MLAFPYDLADLQRHCNAQAAGDPAEYSIRLTTEPWAYGCVFPPSRNMTAACTVEFDVWVAEGQVSVATLGPMGRYCFDEAVIGAGRDQRRIRLRAPSFAHRDALVFRNAAEGICRF